jgi:pimeloyl-ACP methyl ester carboxylesterase
VQRDRPSLWELADRLASIDLPTLIMSGDEDEGCLEPSLFLKRTIKAAGLMVLPNTGHTLNLEEPAIFNAALLDFFHQVETGAWPRRSVPAGAPAAEPT